MFSPTEKSLLIATATAFRLILFGDSIVGTPAPPPVILAAVRAPETLTSPSTFSFILATSVPIPTLLVVLIPDATVVQTLDPPPPPPVLLSVPGAHSEPVHLSTWPGEGFVPFTSDRFFKNSPPIPVRYPAEA